MRKVCRFCKGAGSMVLPGYGSRVCGNCKGTGKEPQTHFDKITESPEELAEFICDIWTKDKHHLFDKFESAEYEQGIGIGGKKVLVEWLMQESTE